MEPHMEPLNKGHLSINEIRFRMKFTIETLVCLFIAVSKWVYSTSTMCVCSMLVDARFSGSDRALLAGDPKKPSQKS